MNEIEPMMHAEHARCGEAACAWTNAAGARLQELGRLETSAAAPPPRPLRSATICGMSVICTARAPHRAERRRRSRAPIRISPAVLEVPAPNSVAITASAMPSAASRLPRARASAGELRRLRPTMKQDRGDQVGDVDEHRQRTFMSASAAACS